MKLRLGWIFSLALFSSFPASAQVDQSSETGEMARGFSLCVAFWEWEADLERASGNPAAAAFTHSIANGARTSAYWLLSAQYVLDHPDAPPRTYGSFDGAVNSVADAERLRLDALLEAEDTATVVDIAKGCHALRPISEQILQQLRKDIDLSNQS